MRQILLAGQEGADTTNHVLFNIGKLNAVFRSVWSIFERSRIVSRRIGPKSRSRSCGCCPAQFLVWGCKVFFRFIFIDFRIDEGDLLESWWIAYKTVERWLCHYMQVHWFESLSCRARWYPYCHHGGLFLSCYGFITGCSDALRNFDRLLCRENALATIYVI